MKIDHYINGNFESSEITFRKLNPFTSETLHIVSSASAIDLVKVIQYGQQAFLDWKSTNLSTRLDYLKKIKFEYMNLKSEIINSESLDQGFSCQFTEDVNYNMGLKIIDRLLHELEHHISQSEKNILFSAVGLTAIILSWNLSNRIFIERVLAALMAGDVVIVKCSSMSPSTGYIWAQIFKKINLPNGVAQIIYGQDQAFKNLLVTHPGVKAISFVGTLKNGSDILKKVTSLSHNQFKKIQISTGGKNPAIVTTEPTESLAVEVFNSFIAGQGQLAWNSARLFILEKHTKEWSELLNIYLNQLYPLESIEQNSLWSPILKKNSIQIFNEIKNLAKADQAKLIFSDKIIQTSENHVRPIFTKDMSNCSTLQQDQILAPLYIISEVKYPFDISKFSNVSYYGFSASLWSESDKAQKIIENLDVGLVSLNQWSIYSSQPMRAVKQSSFGIQDYRIFGDFFSNAKVLS